MEKIFMDEGTLPENQTERSGRPLYCTGGKERELFFPCGDPRRDSARGARFLAEKEMVRNLYLADLHIHSKYSRATSKDCVPEMLSFWAARKGIDLLGTGDFTHPAWRAELREKLIPAEEGLYALRKDLLRKDLRRGAAAPRFVVTGEISSIYKKNGKVRKVHNLILLPGLDAADALAARLEAVGNLHSDGRPILGLDSRDLLEITLDVCPDAVFIPAHIWTPHFSMFGAFSGFTAIEECFEDMTPYIHAVETGLSSDPPMNWRLSALDAYTLVSNSDAHSPQKLGREANLLQAELSYPGLAGALRGRGAQGFAGTIEFFPEEGKYHYDGHRNCGLCLKPEEAARTGGICPVCGRKLTVGVLHRVEQLADRPEGFRPPNAARFESLIPLPEVIAASTECSAAGKKTGERYEALLRELGSEFYILREAPLEEIERVAGPCTAEGIRRMRLGQVTLSPGYDGEYGKIHLLDEKEIGAVSGQISLFGAEERPPAKQKRRSGEDHTEFLGDGEEKTVPEKTKMGRTLNGEQLRAVTATDRAVAVIAGPGTGKTAALTARIVWLVEERGVKPGEITAVTFTSQAAAELKKRLEKHFGGKRKVRAMQIGTFHSICLRRLSAARGNVTVLDETDARAEAAETARALSIPLTPKKLLQAISAVKNGVETEKEAGLPQGTCENYQERLRGCHAMDYDDLLLEELAGWKEKAKKAAAHRAFRHLLVDEFQDCNELQYRLIAAWAEKSGGIFVIGDPDQSIYGFRGSNARCFSRFFECFPQAAQIRLVNNYRSTPEILQCALSAMEGDGVPRTLAAQREAGAAVRLLTAADDFAEAVFVAKEINRMVGGIDMLDAQRRDSRRKGGGVRGFSEIAVLYRTHRQAEVLEYCLRKEGIPYVVRGRDRVLSDPAVREAIGFFRFLLHPEDTAALHRAQRASNRKGGPSGGMPALAALAEQYGPRMQKEKPVTLLEEWARENRLDGQIAMERLLNMALLFEDMPSFLENLTLGGEGDISRCGSRVYIPDAVTLSTLHGAKGLEFPAVFLCGAKKGILPLEVHGRETDVSEERRLLYVGMTRAAEELILLAPGEPSPFLSGVPARLLLTGDAREHRRDTERQISFFD